MSRVNCISSISRICLFCLAWEVASSSDGTSENKLGPPRWVAGSSSENKRHLSAFSDGMGKGLRMCLRIYLRIYLRICLLPGQDVKRSQDMCWPDVAVNIIAVRGMGTQDLEMCLYCQTQSCCVVWKIALIVLSITLRDIMDRWGP